jgi:hypothetical protein
MHSGKISDPRVRHAPRVEIVYVFLDALEFLICDQRGAPVFSEILTSLVCCAIALLIRWHLLAPKFDGHHPKDD